MNFNRVTLQYNNEFVIIVFCYLIVSVITMCNLIKGLISATFLSTPASDMMFMNDEDKRHVQAIKIARKPGLLTIIIIHSKHFPYSDWLNAHT